MTQLRIDTAVLIEYLRRCAAEGRVADNMPNKWLLEIADRLAEQEATIRHLRTELCNASAVAMGHSKTIEKLKKESGTVIGGSKVVRVNSPRRVKCQDNEGRLCELITSIRGDEISFRCDGGDQWAHLSESQAEALADWLLMACRQLPKR
jgi:hypothetical protein